MVKTPIESREETFRRAKSFIRESRKKSGALPPECYHSSDDLKRELEAAIIDGKSTSLTSALDSVTGPLKGLIDQEMPVSGDFYKKHSAPDFAAQFRLIHLFSNRPDDVKVAAHLEWYHLIERLSFVVINLSERLEALEKSNGDSQEEYTSQEGGS